MKNIHILTLATAIALTTSLISCGDPKPDAVPVEPHTETPQTGVSEERDGVKVDVDADGKKIGVEADGVDINIDGKD